MLQWDAGLAARSGRGAWRAGQGAILLAVSVVLMGCPERDVATGSFEAPRPEHGASPDARWRAYHILRRELEASHDASDGGGRAWLTAPASGPQGVPVLRVGSRERFQLLYEAGPLGIEVGGRVWLEISRFWGWDWPQADDPGAGGYTTARSLAPGVSVQIGEPYRHRLPIQIAGRKLAAGEQLEIVYGAGEARARVDLFAETGEQLSLAVDGDGDGTHLPIAEPARLDLQAGPPARLVLRLPATARPGTAVRLTAAVLDQHANAGIPLVGEVVLDPVDGLDLPERFSFQGPDRGCTSVSLGAARGGVFRVRGQLATRSGVLTAESNPMDVRAGGPKLFFGDLHGHSRYSDGTGTPAAYYRYARDVAGLDVAALTDHDHWGTSYLDANPKRWAEIQDVVRRFHEPGRFVALLGYEWTNWVQGHRHVLYFGDHGPLISALDLSTETPDALWGRLRGADALTIAHHPAGGSVPINWAYAPDPELEPLTEIVSAQGSSEAPDSPKPIGGFVEGNSVRDVLERGVRLGFVGSGDGHEGHPGLVNLFYGGGGLAGIYADSLDRAALRAAMRARRVYATNGPRIVLWTTLNEAPMGAALTLADGAARLALRVASEAPLERIDLIRRGGRIETLAGEGRYEFETIHEVQGLQPGDYLYVRVVQEDGGAAWSSPFYIEPNQAQAASR